MSNILSVTFKPAKRAPVNLTEKVYFVNTESKKEAREAATTQLKYDLTLLSISAKWTAEYLLERYDLAGVTFTKIKVLKKR